MNSPLATLAWGIWRRGRRSTWLTLGCVTVCALTNLLIFERLGLTDASRAQFSTIFKLLMTLSFLFLIGIFNYTEFNSTKDWNGFPYRLFVLPIRTWQLVALPMLLGLASAEALYFAWVKLVWTHAQIPMQGWFAVVLGAYVVFYQTTLWSLAGFRITRLVALSLGGMSSSLIASLPFFAKSIPSRWLSERLLIPVMVGLTFIAFLIAWAVIARQRCGGGLRRNRLKMFCDLVVNAMPRRSKDFASPAAAQFWFEWRRTGWLLPVCTALVIIAIITPMSLFSRDDPRYTNDLLTWLLGAAIVLAFVIGKGFIKCEFWSTNLSLPQFIAIRPLSADEFVIAKMKVAALSVVITSLLVLTFIGLWFSLWANTTQLQPHLAFFLRFHPHSWPLILALYVVAFMVLLWRCLVSGLWAGLSGNFFCYAASAGFQVVLLTLMLLADAIWSDALNLEMEKHPKLVISVAVRVIGWSLAVLIIAKIWFAAFTWGKMTSRRTRQYLVIWSGFTLCFIALAILLHLPVDTERLSHLLLLAAFLIFPLARLGLASRALANNRHR
jgi:hypothetical protein